MSTLAAPQFPSHPEDALGRSFALALAVHLVLAAVMALGIRWQSHPPETVTVELWEPPPLPAPAPKVEPPPAPKPEPVQPTVKKPDIVEKAAPKPKPKPEPKKAEVKKPEAKKAEAKPKPIPDFNKRMREEMAREEKALAIERQERDLRALLARQQADARARALNEYIASIQRKVRSNISAAALEGIAGNPAADFDVIQIPTGEVISVRMRKSSGYPRYDNAIHQAILKSSPLPPPSTRDLFERELKLTFKPLDK